MLVFDNISREKIQEGQWFLGSLLKDDVKILNH